MLKKALATMLSLCMVGNSLPMPRYDVFANTVNITSANNIHFTDVSTDSWYYNSVIKAVEKGLFAGTSDSTFSPTDSMTRGMFVTVIGRMMNIDVSKYSGSSFSDVKGNEYYAPYVQWALENGITYGVSEDLFAPNQTIDREQMISLTSRLYDVYDISYDKVTDTLPNDLDSISNYAKEYVIKMWQAQILHGDNLGNFNPKNNATRAEAATYLLENLTIIDKHFNNSNIDLTISTSTEITDEDENEDENEDEKSSASSGGSSASSGGFSGSSGGSGNSNSGSSQPEVEPEIESETLIIPTYTVTFNTNGGDSISNIKVKDGQLLETIPLGNRDGYIFVGWYQDEDFLVQFDATVPIIENISLYALYILDEIGNSQTFGFIESAEIIEVSDLYSYTIDIVSEISLTENEFKNEISITDDNLNVRDEEYTITIANDPITNITTYTLSMDSGFIAGEVYKINLENDDLFFFEDLETIRSISLITEKDDVLNLSLNDSITYIDFADITNIKLVEDIENIDSNNGLTTESMDFGGEGTFEYDDATIELSIGDIVSIYSGTKPSEREEGVDYTRDSVAYLEVVSVSGAEVAYVCADMIDVMFIPDFHPVSLNNITDEFDNTVSLTNINETEQNIIIDQDYFDYSDGSMADMGFDIDTVLDAGDFIVAYEGSELYLAESFKTVEVVSFIEDDDNFIITIKEVQREDALSSLEFNNNQTLDPEYIEEIIDEEAIALKIREQVEDSRFIEEAVEYLTIVALETDEVQSFIANASDKKVIISDPEFKEEVSADADKGTISVLIGIAFDIEIKLSDLQSMFIEVGLVFTEEIKIVLNASGEAVWENKYIIPYISDYIAKANADIYTDIKIELKATANIKSKDEETGEEEETEVDIQESIENLGDAEELDNEFYQMYAELVQAEIEYITLLDLDLFEINTSIDPYGIIKLNLDVDFVVGTSASAALGVIVTYEEANRYSFTIKILSAEASNTKTILTRPTIDFKAYIMGRIGVQAGLEVELAVGLISTKANSVGVQVDVGLFCEIMGLAYYHANYDILSKKLTTDYSGGLYIEVGAYLVIDFLAQVGNGHYAYNPNLYNYREPFLTFGLRKMAFDFEEETDEEIKLSYDKNTLSYNVDLSPAMKVLDLVTGVQESNDYSNDYFEVLYSGEAFTVDKKGNTISLSSDFDEDIANEILTLKFIPQALSFNSNTLTKTYELDWFNVNENGYYLTIETNNGVEIDDLHYYYTNELSALPDDLEKEGFSFAGWYLDEEFTQPFTYTTMPAKNITAYAKWNGIYSVTLDPNGGRFVDSSNDTEEISVIFDELYGDYLLEVSKEETEDTINIYLHGWHTEATVSDGVYLITGKTKVSINEDHKLYAIWGSEPLLQFNQGATLDYTVVGDNNIYIEPLAQGVDFSGDAYAIEYGLGSSSDTDNNSWVWQESNQMMNLPTDKTYYISARLKEDTDIIADVIRNTISLSDIEAPSEDTAVNNDNEFTFEIEIKTQDILYAGTNSDNVYARLGANNETAVNLDSIYQLSGSEGFQRNDNDIADLKHTEGIDALNSSLYINFAASGWFSDWDCDWAKVSIYKIGEKIAETEKINIDKTFKKKTDYFKTDLSFTRVIEALGDFNEVFEDVSLTADNTELLEFKFNGEIEDQFMYYSNIYNTGFAPTMTVSINDITGDSISSLEDVDISNYNNCFVSKVDTIIIDQEKTYSVMEEFGHDTIELKVKLTFENAIIKNTDDNYVTKTFTITKGSIENGGADNGATE